MFFFRKTPLLFAALILLAGHLFAFAEETISDIKIDGLRKTRDSYLQARLEKYIGIPAEELDMRAIETMLQAEGIFESVQTEIVRAEDGRCTLHITVKEKISFIPLPFAASSNGNAMGGIFILDTNAFGVKDLFVFGGILSNESKMAMANFSKPSLGLLKPGYSFGGSFAKAEATFLTLDEDDVLAYDSVGFSVHGSVSDRLTEHSQLSLGAAYNQYTASDEVTYCTNSYKSESYRAVYAAASWGMAVHDWNGWFLLEQKLSLESGLRFFTDRSIASTFSGQLCLERSLFTPRLRGMLQTSGTYRRNEHVSQLGRGSSVNVVILPDNFYSAKLFGTGASLEYAFAKARIALFSVYAGYQSAYSEDTDGAMRFTHGVTGGMKMYLTKIAFPAFAFGLAYNVPLSMLKYSVAFGISM
ncbi:MAG: hypothetical protein K6G80_01200 [Treponema sp.]|nr:hypothetical protein [Treponema sp.]